MPTDFLRLSTTTLVKDFKRIVQEVLSSKERKFVGSSPVAISKNTKEFHSALKIAFHEVVTIFIEDYLNEIGISNDEDYADVTILYDFSSDSAEAFLVRAELDLYFEESFQKLKLNCILNLSPFEWDHFRVDPKEYNELETMLKHIMQQIQRQI